MEIVLRDYGLYVNSEGGVTFSGGEPLLQADFLRKLLLECRKNGLHTAVETCAYVGWDAFEKVKDLVDLWFCDIKTTDGEKHRKGTGVDNALILSNISGLVADGAKVCIRMPLIPGFNDGEEDVRALGQYVRDRLGLTAEDIELLRYNNLGENKTRQLGRTGYDALQPQSQDKMDHLNAVLQNCFDEVMI